MPAPDGNLETLGVYGTVPPFSLTERSGRWITRDDLRGLVWVVDFIYTECTETCPLQSLEFARLQRDFGQAADLRLVSITVDPEHDTAEVLRAYAGRDPAAPTPPECRKTIGLGPAPAWASHGSGGLVMHSARLVLVDRAGVIRAYHPGTDAGSMGRLHANLRQLLAAGSR